MQQLVMCYDNKMVKSPGCLSFESTSCGKPTKKKKKNILSWVTTKMSAQIQILKKIYHVKLWGQVRNLWLDTRGEISMNAMDNLLYFSLAKEHITTVKFGQDLNKKAGGQRPQKICEQEVTVIPNKTKGQILGIMKYKSDL